MKTSDLYKNWVMRIYHDGGTNSLNIEKSLPPDPQLQFCNVKKLNHTLPGISNNILGTFYRASVLADPFIDISCSRDLDSELTTRETAAVNVWLNSSKALHIMRDHVWHNLVLLGGTWCFRQYVYREEGQAIIKRVLEIAQVTNGRNDQHVLREAFFQHFHVLVDTIQHDSYICNRFAGSIPWPTKREDLHTFVGCDDIPCRKYGTVNKCPLACRPKEHKDWEYC